MIGVASPAVAGTVRVVDGTGGWTSTCHAPVAPAVAAHDPEAAADGLNAQILRHNQFVAEAQTYMGCVAEEARRDAEASDAVVARDAKALIAKTQEQVAGAAGRLGNKAP